MQTCFRLYIGVLRPSRDNNSYVVNVSPILPYTGGVSGVHNTCDETDASFDPQRASVQPEVMLIWEELDEGRTILTDLQVRI